MKKSKIILVFICLFLIIGLAGLTFLKRNKLSTEVFPATVNHDCAPWDGSAFTMTVQYGADTEIYISIWKAPGIKFPSTFVLPDNDGQIGNAYILSALGPYTVLNGEVFLQSVSVDKPIEGKFSFRSERGEKFEGRFIAEWINDSVMCG